MHFFRTRSRPRSGRSRRLSLFFCLCICFCLCIGSTLGYIVRRRSTAFYIFYICLLFGSTTLVYVVTLRVLDGFLISDGPVFLVVQQPPAAINDFNAATFMLPRSAVRVGGEERLDGSAAVFVWHPRPVCQPRQARPDATSPVGHSQHGNPNKSHVGGFPPDGALGNRGEKFCESHTHVDVCRSLFLHCPVISLSLPASALFPSPAS